MPPMPIPPRQCLKALLLALCCASFPAATFSAECLSRPVTLMVPYPAGGLSDVIARSLSQPLSKQVGQPVVVENLGGASGSIAAQKVLAAPADGQMIFMGSPNELILAPLATAAIKVRHTQFQSLGPVTGNPLTLLVRADLPVTSFDELITYARDPRNKQLSYGSVGTGSLYHFAAEDLSARAGISMLHVPYKGGAPLLQDMGAGLVDLAIFPWATQYRGLAGQGRLKILAMASRTRESLAPDVPATGESRLLKDFEFSTWAGFFVRKETPASTVACLHEALARTLVQPEVKQAILATGSNPVNALPLDAAQRLMADEAARFQALAKSIKLEPQ